MFIFVGHDPVHFRLEIAEEREPNSRSSRVPLHEGLVVGERVIVEEEAARYVEGDEHVDRVMLVAGQDEENAEHVQHPSERVQQVNISRSI